MIVKPEEKSDETRINEINFDSLQYYTNLLDKKIKDLKKEELYNHQKSFLF